MKCLKIDNGKGFFSLDGDSWSALDEISKECILTIINLCLESSFEMDSPTEVTVHNKAHDIIYKNLYAKFLELNNQRTRFKDESENLFKEALAKYS
ncbi:hypothetical protein [Acinetobacter pittii]|uniref:hypothetical protein n=1 Tax=Acinetobacter pittii TaxID=48296 RepID=UPI00227951D1|nr:hypothetical protein [Acinetobacter pittii]MCY3236413.1 hypothetical protein [Acinetobacter pittii]MCY3288557.1 hypothetical protein [Acinetobacter pittii]MCY3296857.1 hypothetical protein [Acinetobacter pittii]MCY3304249.1 hypothetical protein [Acinetobacter pittii]MCY3404005.1 hypothetical protein [Acinetobacter pittii]